MYHEPFNWILLLATRQGAYQNVQNYNKDKN